MHQDIRRKSFICSLHWQFTCSDLLISKGTYVPTVYLFGIILLSSLHGYKPLPGWNALRGQLLLILKTLSDLTLKNNCSSLQKLKIIKAFLFALGQRDFYREPRTGCCQPRSTISLKNHRSPQAPQEADPPSHQWNQQLSGVSGGFVNVCVSLPTKSKQNYDPCLHSFF